jgi:RNA polymerase sigma factor (sigma-70 family)
VGLEEAATMSEVALHAPVVTEARAADSWTDAALVRACLNGNEEAWSALIDRYKRLIYSIPIKYGLSTDQANDIFQDACVDLLAALPRLREPQALPKWLMQVAAHKCARVKARDRQYAHGDPETETGDVADTQPTSDQILCEVEREQSLRTACAALPVRCRSLVHMLFFESPTRPYKEIARELGIATGSVGFIRARCLQRLRTELKKHGF